MTEVAISRRRLFRKRLILPTEHGSWSWLLVPFFVGAAISAGIGMAGDFATLASVLTLVGGLAAFLVRQPASAWLRIRRGRASRADEPLAAGWTLGLALVAGFCLAGLLALGRAALLWLVIPFALVLALYLVAARGGRAAMRALWTELIGAVGLALMAPAAVIAVTGVLGGLAWALWGLMGLQNALGVLYVRLRLADTRGRSANRSMVLVGHAIGLGLVVIAALASRVPPLSLIPFAVVLLRAAWVVREPRPVAVVRRFGFTEVGVEALSGLWIVVSYWMW
jgi:hypothetical protein